MRHRLTVLAEHVFATHTCRLSEIEPGVNLETLCDADDDSCLSGSENSGTTAETPNVSALFLVLV